MVKLGQRRKSDGDELYAILRNLRDLEIKSQPWSQHQLRKVQKREKDTTRWGRNAAAFNASGVLSRPLASRANARKLAAQKFREKITEEAQKEKHNTRAKRSRKLRTAKKQAILATNGTKNNNDKQLSKINGKMESTKRHSSMSSHIMSLNDNCFSWQQQHQSPARETIQQQHQHVDEEENEYKHVHNNRQALEAYGETNINIKQSELDSTRDIDFNNASTSPTSTFIPALKLFTTEQLDPGSELNLDSSHSLGPLSISALKLSTTTTFPHIGERFKSRAADQLALIDHMTSFSQWQSRLCEQGLLHESQLADLPHIRTDAPRTPRAQRIQKLQKHVRWSSQVDELEIERRLAVLEQPPLGPLNIPSSGCLNSLAPNDLSACENDANEFENIEDETGGDKQAVENSCKLRKPAERIRKDVALRKTRITKQTKQRVVAPSLKSKTRKILMKKEGDKICNENNNDDNGFEVYSNNEEEDEQDSVDDRYEDDTFD